MEKLEPKISESDVHYLYFMIPRVEKPDRIKIGITDNLERRRKQIRASYGSDVVCFWSVGFSNREWARNMEKQFHQSFSRYRLSGEWFKFCDPIMEFPFYLKDQGLPGTIHKPNKLGVVLDG